MRFVFPLVALLGFTAAATAESRMSLLERFEAGDPVTAGDFRAIASNRVLEYRMGGVPVYEEHFIDNSGAVSLFWPDGQCENGHWYEEDQTICFDWEEYGKMYSVWSMSDQLYVRGITDGTISSFVSDVIVRDDPPRVCKNGMV